MRRGRSGRSGRGRSGRVVRGGGVGPNSSLSCRWFPDRPRGWWRSPYSYGYGTPYGYRYPYF